MHQQQTFLTLEEPDAEDALSSQSPDHKHLQLHCYKQGLVLIDATCKLAPTVDRVYAGVPPTYIEAFSTPGCSGTPITKLEIGDGGQAQSQHVTDVNTIQYVLLATNVRAGFEPDSPGDAELSEVSVSVGCWICQGFGAGELHIEKIA